jgi:hypothetical protein
MLLFLSLYNVKIKYCLIISKHWLNIFIKKVFLFAQKTYKNIHILLIASILTR